jgi:uncharacterized protein
VLLSNFFLSLIFVLGMGSYARSFEVPSLQGPVMDEVGLLDTATRQQLAAALFQLQKSERVQLQVYVTKSLQGESIEGAAIKIFDHWKLGDEKTDKGLLFLIAPNEKRMRIEVGQGLEGDIPDVIAKRIIEDVVKPYFQQGEFSQGIVQGVIALQRYMGSDDRTLGEARAHPRSEPGSQAKGKGWIFLIVGVLWLILFMFNPSLALYILFSAFRGGGGGGGGGGSWSGGGGRSSGGGASGSW